MDKSFIVENLPSRDYSDFTGHYGAEKIVNEYCSTNNSYRIPGLWQHGPFLLNKDYLFARVALITDEILHTFAKSSWNYYVARKDMVSLLKECGYKRVFNIGLPFLYLQDMDINEVKETALFFPEHSGVGERVKDFSVYDEYLKVLKAKFTYVGICIHANDYSEGIIKELLSMGFDLAVVGADERDANSLYRIKYLILHFEYILSDTFSSALVYGAYLNKKIGILPSLNQENSISSHNAQNELRFLKLSLQNIEGAKRHQAWGERLLGDDSKRSPKELRKLFYFNKFNRLYFLFWFVRKKIKRYFS